MLIKSSYSLTKRSPFPLYFSHVSGEGDEETDLNTVVFSMKVTGGEPTSAGLIEGDEDVMLGGNEPGPYTSVYSSSIEWTPEGSQEERFKVPAKPVHDDILVAKLAKDQCIELEAHAVKGIGKDHAKFSPVSTASYRLLPKITLSAEKPFEGDEADALVAKCPLNVFDIEDIRGPSSSKGTCLVYSLYALFVPSIFVCVFSIWR